jgi:hypothetical protein
VLACAALIWMHLELKRDFKDIRNRMESGAVCGRIKQSKEKNGGRDEGREREKEDDERLICVDPFFCLACHLFFVHFVWKPVLWMLIIIIKKQDTSFSDTLFLHI